MIPESNFYVHALLESEKYEVRARTEFTYCCLLETNDYKDTPNPETCHQKICLDCPYEFPWDLITGADVLFNTVMRLLKCRGNKQ